MGEREKIPSLILLLFLPLLLSLLLLLIPLETEPRTLSLACPIPLSYMWPHCWHFIYLFVKSVAVKHTFFFSSNYPVTLKVYLSGSKLIYVSCFHTVLMNFHCWAQVAVKETGSLNITRQSISSCQDGFRKIVNILKAIQFQVWIYSSILWIFVLLFYWLGSQTYINIGSFLGNFTLSRLWRRW